jgi:WD40 repeat protein
MFLFSIFCSHITVLKKKYLFQIHDTATGHLFFQKVNPHRCRFTAVRWVISRQDLIVLDELGYLQVWNVFAEANLKTARLRPGPLNGLSLAGPEQLLVVSAECAEFWRVSREARQREFRGHAASVIRLCWLEDNRLVSTSLDNTIRTWDAHDLSCKSVIRAPSSEISCLIPLSSAAPTHESDASTATEAPVPTVVTGHQDGTIRLWNIDAASAVVLHGHRAAVTALVLVRARTHRIEFLVSAAADGQIVMWDVSRRRTMTPWIEFSFVVSARDIACLHYNANNHTLLFAGSDGLVHILDMLTNLEFEPLAGHSDAVTCLAQDVNVLFSGGDDGVIVVWDLFSCIAMGTLAGPAGHTGAVRDLALVPHTGWLLSCGADARVLLWDYAAGSVLQTITLDAAGAGRCLLYQPASLTLNVDSLAAALPPAAAAVLHAMTVAEQARHRTEASQSSQGAAHTEGARWGGGPSTSAAHGVLVGTDAQDILCHTLDPGLFSLEHTTFLERPVAFPDVLFDASSDMATTTGGSLVTGGAPPRPAGPYYAASVAPTAIMSRRAGTLPSPALAVATSSAAATVATAATAATNQRGAPSIVAAHAGQTPRGGREGREGREGRGVRVATGATTMVPMVPTPPTPPVPPTVPGAPRSPTRSPTSRRGTRIASSITTAPTEGRLPHPQVATGLTSAALATSDETAPAAPRHASPPTRAVIRTVPVMSGRRDGIPSLLAPLPSLSPPAQSAMAPSFSFSGGAATTRAIAVGATGFAGTGGPVGAATPLAPGVLAPSGAATARAPLSYWSVLGRPPPPEGLLVAAVDTNLASLARKGKETKDDRNMRASSATVLTKSFSRAPKAK